MEAMGSWITEGVVRSITEMHLSHYSLAVYLSECSVYLALYEKVSERVVRCGLVETHAALSPGLR